ncbi:MAG: hypothetical protein KAR01_04385, partial [Desulfocapsa sp.]|nr:hypothetical protein [Desulfocapsa sp.]
IFADRCGNGRVSYFLYFNLMGGSKKKKAEKNSLIFLTLAIILIWYEKRTGGVAMNTTSDIITNNIFKEQRSCYPVTGQLCYNSEGRV